MEWYFVGLYLEYDTQAELMPQFEKNAEALQSICNKLRAFISDKKIL